MKNKFILKTNINGHFHAFFSNLIYISFSINIILSYFLEFLISFKIDANALQ